MLRRRPCGHICELSPEQRAGAQSRPLPLAPDLMTALAAAVQRCRSRWSCGALPLSSLNDCDRLQRAAELRLDPIKLVIALIASSVRARNRAAARVLRA